MAWCAAGEMVTCRECSRHYRCTPEDDYYNATGPTNGVCERCLIGDLTMRVEGPIYERCASCGQEYLFPHLCRQHMLCGLCHPAPEETCG